MTPDDPVRERGWIAVIGLTLVAVLFSVVQPALLLFTPLALLLLSLPPRRLSLMLVGAVLLVAALWGAGGSALWYFERGWVLVLGGWFVVSVVVWRDAPFVTRGLAAVGATAVSTALLFAAQRGGFASVDWAVAERLRRGASEAAAMWSQGLGFGRVAEQLSERALELAELQAQLYPALLGIASLSALAVAWWSYRRLALKEPDPLGRLREFRFPDALVWLLIAGLLLLLLPLEAAGTRMGTNVLVFMAALYALRGVAVLVAIMGAPGVLATVVGAVLALLLYPLVLTLAAVVGLTDTWLDIRSRRRAGAGPGR